jgi:hypothetical protein
MGFPPTLWFEDMSGDGVLAVPEEGQDLASQLEYLFQTVVHPTRSAVRVRSSALLVGILHNSVPGKGLGGAHPFTQRPFENALFAGLLQRLTNHFFLRRPRNDTHSI